MTTPLKIDLDAAGAARAAANEEIGQGPAFIFRGQTFELPPEMLVEVSVYQAEAAEQSELQAEARKAMDAARGKDQKAQHQAAVRLHGGRADRATVNVMRALVGDQWEAFLALHPTNADMRELITQLMEYYGTTAGESNASDGPSETTGPRPRRTSKPTTA